MRRREFITLIGGAAAAWPLAARAQQPNQMRRIGVLMGGGQKDSANVTAFFSRMEQLGWKPEANLHADVRWCCRAGADGCCRHGDVGEGARCNGCLSNLALAVLKPLAQNVPIVFIAVGDPVGSGFVASLSHPGGNITGFASYDGPMGSKWLEVLKETAPQLTRVMAIMHAETPVHQAFWKSIQASAEQFGVEVTQGGIHDVAEIENSISAFAGNEYAGLIILPHALMAANRELFIALARRYRLPAVYADENAVPAGALVSYGIDLKDSFVRAADYVDRILRGAKPADLPVQEPTKFRLTYNLKTAREIGLNIPPIMLSRADEVIE